MEQAPVSEQPPVSREPEALSRREESLREQYSQLARTEYERVQQAPPNKRSAAKRYLQASVLAVASLLGSAAAEAAPGGRQGPTPVQESGIVFTSSESTTLHAAEAAGATITAKKESNEQGGTYKVTVKVKRLVSADASGRSYSVFTALDGYTVRTASPGDTSTDGFHRNSTIMSYSLQKGQELQVHISPELAAQAGDGEIIITTSRSWSPSL